MKPVTGDPESRPSVTIGDSIYYRHPDTGVAHHGVVAAVGKHGVTTDADGGGEHQVRWDSFLGHRKRAERKLTIVDRGEEGSIMEDEDGKRLFVRGSFDDYNPPDGEDLQKSIPAAPAEPSMLEKAQVLRELATAGFEPMMDYVKDTFGEQFVYRQPLIPVDSTSPDVVAAIQRLADAQAAQSQGLCAAISMLADKIGDTGALQQSLMAVLAEARKPQDVAIHLPGGLMHKSEPANVQVDVHVPAQPAPVITVEVPKADAPVVHVAAPAVTFNAPENQQISIVSMPERKTETRVERNNKGDLVSSSQVESDVNK